MAVMLALFTSERWPAYQRVSTLLDEETVPKTTVDENAPPRSIIAQFIDFMTDNEFVTFLGLTGYTAEQLDKEEKEFVKIIQSDPQLYEAHLHEEIAKHAAITRQSLANKFGENWASLVDTNNFFFQMSIFYNAEQEALRRTKDGEPTDQQREEADMKEMRDRERNSYQIQNEYIAVIQDHLNSTREWEKKYPNDLDNKYQRMDCELRLAQQQAEFELYRPLWVHLGILSEDDVRKRDETLDSFALLNMSIRIDEEVEKKEREIWNASDPKLRAWIAAEEAKLNAVMARSETLVGEELERWWDLEALDFDLAANIAMDDAKFARWRASVNEAAAPPAQNPGGCCWKKLLLFPLR